MENLSSRPVDFEHYSAREFELNRFHMTLRGLLVGILVCCVAIVSFQHVLARWQFNDVKDNTRKRLMSLDWGDETAERRALANALDEITYSNRLEPRIIFATVKESIITKKLESYGVGSHTLLMGWFDLDRRVDAIRFGLKNGDHVDYQIREDFEKDALYCQEYLFLGTVGIENGRDIASISLIGQGVPLSKSTLPKLRLGDQSAE